MNEKEIIDFLNDDDVVFFIDGKLSSVCPLKKNRSFFWRNEKHLFNNERSC